MIDLSRYEGCTPGWKVVHTSWDRSLIMADGRVIGIFHINPNPPDFDSDDELDAMELRANAELATDAPVLLAGYKRRGELLERAKPLLAAMAARLDIMDPNDSYEQIYQTDDLFMEIVAELGVLGAQAREGEEAPDG